MRLSQIHLEEKFKNQINLLLKINSSVMNYAEDINKRILIKNGTFKNLYRDINNHKIDWLKIFMSSN
jgi:hypothetical protein